MGKKGTSDDLEKVVESGTNVVGDVFDRAAETRVGR